MHVLYVPFQASVCVQFLFVFQNLAQPLLYTQKSESVHHSVTADSL